MDKKNLSFEEEFATVLRQNLLNQVQTTSRKTRLKTNINDFELISNSKKEISPIFSLNEDEIIAFVECAEVSELANLTNEELDYIGKALGVNPRDLI